MRCGGAICSPGKFISSGIAALSYLKGHYNADRPGRVSDWNDTANGAEARAKATELARPTHVAQWNQDEDVKCENILIIIFYFLIVILELSVKYLKIFLYFLSHTFCSFPCNFFSSLILFFISYSFFPFLLI